MNSNKGFTLIELVTVVAILSVLVTLATMSWLDYLPKNRVNAAMDELFTEMQRAKIKSVSENREYSITFNTTANSYSIYYDNSGTPVLVKTVSIPTNYTKIQFGRNTSAGVIPGTSGSGAVTFTGTPPKAIFYTTGLGKAGTVYLMPEDDTARDDRHRAITVSPAGRIKAWKHTGSAWE
ncbi:MAG: Tfp pilus assembly protein FimT/FimU [Desulfatirhabdiaceae bacterium]